MKTVSLLGYGRFGAALSALFVEAGIAVRGFDPHTRVPDDLRASSLDELVSSAELLVVAVPVPEMRAAFTAIRPLLRPTQTVIDVGSVKEGPARAMAEIFGRERPWVATHPLFGPVSLARGDRPLTIVVCPNPHHPEAVQRISALAQRIGCEVVFQMPEEHDRAMAYTHALTFFVAKGLLDAGAPTYARHAPPSFHAIARTIELVRADSAHLFEALHVENPYAAEARRKLVDALLAVHQELGRVEAVPVEGPANLASQPPGVAGSANAIPDLDARSPELRETRELIDDLDQELVALLARRAASAKAELGHGVRDPGREARLLETRRRWASEQGLDPSSVEGIFHAILDFSRRVQESPRGGAAPTPSGSSS